MQQKIKLMRYLIIGISGIFFMTGCEAQIEYVINAKWTYINETEHSISFEPNAGWKEFDIQGNDTIVYLQHSDGSKEVTANSFEPPVNGNVIIDGIICDSILTRRVRNISEYESKKIAERNFEFVFRYTSDKLNLSDTCR